MAETFVIVCGVVKTSVLCTNVIYEYVYIASERQTEKRRVLKVLYVGCSSEHRPSLDTKFKCAGLSYQRTLRPSLPGGQVWLRAGEGLGAAVGPSSRKPVSLRTPSSSSAQCLV